MANKEPNGYTCACGQVNEFNGYVAAHWSERLIGRCEKCDREVVVQCGRVAPKRRRFTDGINSFSPTYKTP